MKSRPKKVHDCLLLLFDPYAIFWWSLHYYYFLFFYAVQHAPLLSSVAKTLRATKFETRSRSRSGKLENPIIPSDPRLRVSVTTIPE